MPEKRAQAPLIYKETRGGGCNPARQADKIQHAAQNALYKNMRAVYRARFAQ